MNAANCKIKTVHITNPDKLYDSLNVNHLKEPAIYNRLSFNLLIFLLIFQSSVFANIKVLSQCEMYKTFDFSTPPTNQSFKRVRVHGPNVVYFVQISWKITWWISERKRFFYVCATATYVVYCMGSILYYIRSNAINDIWYMNCGGNRVFSFIYFINILSGLKHPI